MNTKILPEIKATRGKLALSVSYNGKITRGFLFRVDGWTTNGFWMIRTENETKLLQSVLTAPSDKFPPPPVNRVIPQIEDLQELQTDNKLTHVTQFPDMRIIRLASSNAPDVFINAYIYKYFTNRNTKLMQNRSSKYNPVCLVENSQIIGLIMPLHL